MFKVTCTGKNKHYGEQGQVRLLNDHLLATAIKEEWVTNKIEYAESGKQLPIKKVKQTEQLMPIKKVCVTKIVETQNKTLQLLTKKIQDLTETNKKLIRLLQ